MKNILIVRLSAIGDVAMSTTILPGLRRKWPDAHIHWLTEDMGGEVLRGNPEVDRLIVLPRRKWSRMLKQHKYLSVIREIHAAVREVRACDPDLAIDAQGLLRSAFWTYTSGAGKRIGLRSHEGSQHLMSEVVQVTGNPTGRMCNEYRCLLEHIAAPEAPFAMSLRPTQESRKAALEQIPDGTPAPVFLFPFTTRPQKHWFPERWAELAARIVRETGRTVWILGGPSDEAEATRIATESGVTENIKIVAGRDSNIEQKMGLVERAGASVGVDTGLSHISLGLGTPTVVMFGSTCGYLETAPLPGIILYDKMPCSPCRRHPTCNGDFTCMKKITVDMAFCAVQKMLEGCR